MGNEMEKDNIIETSPGDDDLMLPEGYGADDDLFADPKTWTGKQADESAEESGDGEDGKDDGAEDAPTTAQDTAQDVNGSENAETPTTESAAPTTAQEKAETAANKLKFRAKYDSQEQDVEMDVSELPTMWQKARNQERTHSQNVEYRNEARLNDEFARRVGYSSMKEMREKAEAAYRDAEVKSLMDSEGVSERVAKAIVEQEMAQKSAAHDPAPKSGAPAKRDPKTEVDELLAARPDLRGKQLPEEVFVSAQAGKNLLLAYTEYEARQKEAEAKKVQQENSILKQNAANTAKAPVKGTASGGSPKDKGGEDDFLKGFNADN